MVKIASFWCAIYLFSGCAGSDSFGGSRATLSAWGQDRGFITDEVMAGPRLRLLRLQRGGGGHRSEVLTIYLEGDGAPWLSPWHPPADPTPLRPIAMALAAAHRKQMLRTSGTLANILKTPPVHLRIGANDVLHQK